MPKLNKTGRFTAKVTKVQLGQAQTGTPFFQFSFDTPDGFISGWLYLSEAAKENTIRRLKEVFGIGNDARQWISEMENKECDITVEAGKDDKGNDRLEVKFINPVGGGMKPVTPVANESSFLDSLSNYAARLPAALPKAAPTRQQAAPVGAKKDPF